MTRQTERHVLYEGILVNKGKKEILDLTFRILAEEYFKRKEKQKGITCFRCRAGESEPGVFCSLEPEPEPLEKKTRSRSRLEKKQGAGAGKN